MYKDQEKKIYNAASSAGLKQSSTNPSVMTNGNQSVKRLSENTYKVNNNIHNGYKSTMDAISKMKK